MILRDTIIKSATKVSGTATVGKKNGDAWWNDEIRVALDEKKQAYLRTVKSQDLSNEEKIRLKIDYRAKKRKSNRLIKESKVN